MPKIIKFLGYLPQDTRPETLGEKIIACRLLLGLSQEALAKRLGVDPGTLARWEKGTSQSIKQYLETLAAFFTSLPSGGGLLEG